MVGHRDGSEGAVVPPSSPSLSVWAGGPFVCCDTSQVRTTQVRIQQVRTTQVRTSQVRTIQSRLCQVRKIQVGTIQVRTSQLRTDPLRAPEGRTTQVCALEILDASGLSSSCSPWVLSCFFSRRKSNPSATSFMSRFRNMLSFASVKALDRLKGSS